MLKDVKHLYDMGFAIHLLRPKSKMPIEKGWTKGLAKTWAELTKLYKPGMNVGVRLGAASHLRNGYLAVIDCDVKSKDPKHKLQMMGALDKVFENIPDWDKCPQVSSGRGNGSAHFYIVTPTPIVPARLAQSLDNVEVKMPSVKPSKNDLEFVSEARIKEGFRLRPAWEISLMGEGQQVVLPPSLHPDSGRKYCWSGNSTEMLKKGIPLVSNLVNSGTKKSGYGATSIPKFEFVEVDLYGRGLSTPMVAAITDGEDVSDRSAALFSAALAMTAAGMSEMEILSVLTDRNNYLGNAAFDHAQTSSRDVAAQWVQNYTFKKAKHTTGAEGHFETDFIDPPKLDAESAQIQAKEILPEVPTFETDGKGRLKNTLKNTLNLVCAVSPQMFRRNEFSNKDIYGAAPPWNDSKIGNCLEPDDLVNMNIWFAKSRGIEPGRDKISQVITHIATENKFHPVRDWLETLKWDGVPRINTWLKDYLGAEGPEPYLSDVSRKFLCAMIARVYEPGIKFDSVLILEGAQDIGKSTVAAILGGEWFTDAPIKVGDKDSVLAIQGKWIMEVGELSSFKRGDVEDQKRWLSCTDDEIRVPYGDRVQRFPRQCVFLGTTNHSQYSRDTTGNRRFWPVRVHKVDIAGFRAVRDQLLAEA